MRPPQSVKLFLRETDFDKNPNLIKNLYVARFLLITLLFCTLVWELSAFSNTSFQLKNTYYYFIDESNYAPQKQSQPVLSLDDETLAMVAESFFKDLKMEGSGKILNGQMLNYAGVKDGEVRFTFTKNPFGTGAGDCALIPYHSIAVDPKMINLGSKVFIKETLNMLLPDGTIHDGIWMAEDTGSAIKENRVDLFVGDDRKGHFLDLAQIHHMQALSVEVLEAPKSESCVYKSIPKFNP